MSQEKLAQEAELNTSEISNLERGWRNPKWETMKRLAKGLGVPCSRMVRIAELLDEQLEDSTQAAE